MPHRTDCTVRRRRGGRCAAVGLPRGAARRAARQAVAGHARPAQRGAIRGLCAAGRARRPGCAAPRPASEQCTWQAMHGRMTCYRIHSHQGSRQHVVFDVCQCAQTTAAGFTCAHAEHGFSGCCSTAMTASAVLTLERAMACCPGLHAHDMGAAQAWRARSSWSAARRTGPPWTCSRAARRRPRRSWRRWRPAENSASPCVAAARSGCGLRSPRRPRRVRLPRWRGPSPPWLPAAPRRGPARLLDAPARSTTLLDLFDARRRVPRAGPGPAVRAPPGGRRRALPGSDQPRAAPERRGAGGARAAGRGGVRGGRRCRRCGAHGARGGLGARGAAGGGALCACGGRVGPRAACGHDGRAAGRRARPQGEPRGNAKGQSRRQVAQCWDARPAAHSVESVDVWKRGRAALRQGWRAVCMRCITTLAGITRHAADALTRRTLVPTMSGLVASSA